MILRRRVVASTIVAVALAATACFPETTPVPTTGTVSVWGYNGFGNLGIGNRVDQALPTTFAAPPGARFTAVSAGGFHTLALATDGTVYAAGRDDDGQLGNDAAFDYQVSPVAVAAPPGVHFTSVAAGGYHSLAIGSDGNTYAWGQDEHGQLGDDAALVHQSLPVRVATPPGVRFVAVSAGFAHSLAIGDDGGLYSWGYNGFGELGNGIRGRDQAVPGLAGMPVRATAISAGGHHNLAVGDNGVTYSWGWDGHGQLGDDIGLADRLTPVAVAAPAGVQFTRIAAGARHSVAVGSDGDSYAWGDDTYGQVGDDAALSDRALPTKVALPLGVQLSGVAAGGDHTVALARNGLIYTWGLDDGGQLGNDTATVDQPTAVIAATASGRTPIAVSAGYYHSVAILG